ncbi:DUF2513 domain-containing protein [Paenibacillus brevis]|uniref:DUF2513 domain-containing protein n=1 Tax=Paenibacillus brevis TaxID=2841508 RepID=A0ABS6FVU3_9BACL|nr:DUF2513 domain-containing protein [Paenibacillus brevis]MBU5673260.1 DUF2513 domain-containing protein [Paenibacillus brevis]
MKLNHDCVRDLLLTIEETLPLDAMALTTGLHQHENLSKYEYAEIVYCVSKLREAGYIETIGQDLISPVGRVIKVRGLTYTGHLFLDNIRDNKVWRTVKRQAATLASVSMNMLTSLAESTVKQMLGLGIN